MCEHRLLALEYLMDQMVMAFKRGDMANAMRLNGLYEMVEQMTEREFQGVGVRY